jgi:hypothetical protein
MLREMTTTTERGRARRTRISLLWTALGRRFGRGIHVFIGDMLIRLIAWEEIISADFCSCVPKKAADNEVLCNLNTPLLQAEIRL